ncbi:hypothetical protein P43SY_009356 [Pythium insidiosum]|uniref:Tyrosinase copper-binding domain-containing protein n=1 Tax=Pythium insidiosum TaxID=114742 RepID=A0AAD5M541_PYTIN|nr:hypothetical protein P43SY_009356 [Pythium insidiosum]
MAKIRGLRALISVLLATAALLVSDQYAIAQSVPAGTACTQPRVRKSWDDYSRSEKSTYLSAVATAMTRGFHQKFVEMHIEFFSEQQAHGNCMFIYWHRMYLLGYENMLRSLAPRFQCVTLPYWNHPAAHAAQTARRCGSIEGCARIVREFGGSTTGKTGAQLGAANFNALRIYNVSVAPRGNGRCVTTGVAAYFCGNNTPCARCIVRGTPRAYRYPTEASLGSLNEQVFTTAGWRAFASGVEGGVHNLMHSLMGGIMGFLQSPIDPLFFSHHSFIDLLQAVYLKCQLRSEKTLLTAAQKGSDTRFWDNCPRRGGGTYRNTDFIAMNTRNNANLWVNVSADPNNMLHPFFKDLPQRFSDYVDAKDLGRYSYTYAYSGPLTNMYMNCARSTSAAAANIQLADDADESAYIEVEVDGQVFNLLRPVLRPPKQYENRARRWAIAMYEAARISGYTEKAAREQMETMLCVNADECAKAVEDYSDEFREAFRVTSKPRCLTLVEQVKKGERIIGVPGWRAITKKFIPCEVPEDKEPPCDPVEVKPLGDNGEEEEKSAVGQLEDESSVA